jgi:hypothetical protein
VNRRSSPRSRSVRRKGVRSDPRQETFKRLIKGWDERAFTEKDFYRLCNRFGILVFEENPEDMDQAGMYTVVEGIPVIFIDKTLRGLKRLWVMFHELGHHLLHTPETCFFSDSTVNKAQSEANAFAACALIPRRPSARCTCGILRGGRVRLEVVSDQAGGFRKYKV